MPGRVLRRVIYQATAFTSAFFAFAVEPAAGKLLLPHFGGGPEVWSTCLVFFQVVLFAGYLLGHLSSRLPPRAQASLVLAIGGAAIILTERAVSALARTPSVFEAGHFPAFAVARTLLVTFGPSFLVLTATAPLLQHWLAISGKPNPLSLYAISNAGALVGLVGYPVAIEPWLGLGAQLEAYPACFFAFWLALVGASAFLPKEPLPAPGPTSSEARTAPRWWLLLAALPSLLLVAVSHHVTLDVAGGPLLWAIPLTAYLLSFVVAFGRGTPSRTRAPSLFVLGAGASGLGALLLAQGTAPAWLEVGASATVLFTAGLLCHGELVRTRPALQDLTGFYLYIALGGALGGLAGGILAPRVFNGFYELPLAVLAILATLFFKLRVNPAERATLGERWALLLGVAAACPVLLAALYAGSATAVRDGVLVERRRSFFGVSQVARFPDRTVLTHGRIRHGMQWNDDLRRHRPTLYFTEKTALGRVLSMPGPPRRVGVLGLGVGTIAAYGRRGDALTFYEIDPVLTELAEQHFSFLQASAAHVEIRPGDGRRSLALETPRGFDVLVLDAFSSDSVPAHLLTVEAFELYLRHLAMGGVLVANASNRHLEIDRVIAGSARAHGLAFALCESATDPAGATTLVRWVVMTRTSERLREVLGSERCTDYPARPVTFSDERSSLLWLLATGSVS